MANENTYWNNKGTHQELAEALQALLPREGEVADAANNPELEKFRQAVNCYYDLFNNGLCNRSSEFRRIFTTRIPPREDGQVVFDEIPDTLEQEMSTIILAAVMEQYRAGTLKLNITLAK